MNSLASFSYTQITHINKSFTWILYRQIPKLPKCITEHLTHPKLNKSYHLIPNINPSSTIFKHPLCIMQKMNSFLPCKPEHKLKHDRERAQPGSTRINFEQETKINIWNYSSGCTWKTYKSKAYSRRQHASQETSSYNFKHYNSNTCIGSQLLKLHISSHNGSVASIEQGTLIYQL